MMSIGARIGSVVRSGLLVALALGVTTGAVAAGERHAASVVAVDPPAAGWSSMNSASRECGGRSR
jgi:hypothetical protein